MKNAAVDKIHVMHVLPSLEVGGMENGVVNLANGIDKEAFRVSVCCLSKLGPLANRLSDKVPVFNMQQRDGKAFSLPAKLHRLYREEKVDVVHTHNDYAGLYGVLGAKWGSVRAVVHGEHGLSDFVTGYRRSLKKLTCSFADRITTVSAGLKEDVVEFWGVPAEKITVLLNGVNWERFSRSKTLKSGTKGFSRNADEIIVGTVGRLSAQKNYPLLLQSMSDVVKRASNVRLAFVGDGPLRNELQRITRRLGIQDNVVFLGERSDIPEVLSLMDIFVLPSSTGEGIANSMLEAMSMGLPVIASDIKGNIEVVLDQETGFLFRSNDFEELTDRILRLSLDLNLRQRLGVAGSERVQQVFSLERMISNYEAFYRDLLWNRN